MEDIMSVDDSYVKGLKKMKEMGREDTMLNQRKISEDMYKLSVGALFGDIWNRPHLSLRDRQLITMNYIFLKYLENLYIKKY